MVCILSMARVSGHPSWTQVFYAWYLLGLMKSYPSGLQSTLDHSGEQLVSCTSMELIVVATNVCLSYFLFWAPDDWPSWVFW